MTRRTPRPASRTIAAWTLSLAGLAIAATTATASDARAEDVAPEQDAPPPRPARVKDSAVVFSARSFALTGARFGGGPDVGLDVKWFRAGLFADASSVEASRTSALDAGARAGFAVPFGSALAWETEALVASRRYDWNPAGGWALDHLFDCTPAAQYATTTVVGAQSGLAVRAGHFFAGGYLYYEHDVTPVRMSYPAHDCGSPGLFNSGGSYPADAIALAPDRAGLLLRVGALVSF